MREAVFGLGCFWGAERIFWQLAGVYSTAVGYAGGFTLHPTYRGGLQRRDRHAEVVRLIYDPQKIDYQDLLEAFWESHDPTQGMRQGNDVGTPIPLGDLRVGPEAARVRASVRSARNQARLTAAGRGAITTEIRDAPEFFYAEDYHQQYLAKNPDGYCGIGGCGVRLMSAAVQRGPDTMQLTGWKLRHTQCARQ